MKWRYPPFSAMTGDQSMREGSRRTVLPSKSVISQPSFVIVAISPSFRKRAFLVMESIAGMSDERSISLSPTPTMSGHSRRAPTTLSGSSSLTAAMANVPFRYLTASLTASLSPFPFFVSRCMRWLITSVSVSDLNLEPSFLRDSFNWR